MIRGVAENSYVFFHRFSCFSPPLALNPDAINNQLPSVFNTGSGVASTILQSKEDEEDGSEGGDNEIDPMPDFKPIVQLDKVDVHTGMNTV